MFTVITGNAGSGKTMLLNTVAETAPAVDLDACGTNLRGKWLVPPALVEACAAQGFRIFGGVPDIVQHLWLIPSLAKKGGVVLELQRSDPNAMKQRHEWNRRNAPEEVDRWKDRLEETSVEYAIPIPSTWVVKRVITEQLGRVPEGRKSGRAVDSDVRSWRIAFPTPSCLFVGWTPEGSPKEVDDVISEYFDWVERHRQRIVTLASQHKPTKSEGRPTATLWRLIPGADELFEKARKIIKP